MRSPDALRLSLCLSAAVLLLSACAHKNKGTPDNEPTLKTLASRTVDVQPDHALVATPEQAINAYRGFLDIAPTAVQREEAMRRMVVNACYWCVGLEDKIPAKSEVEIIGKYDEYKKGTKPH